MARPPRSSTESSRPCLCVAAVLLWFCGAGGVAEANKPTWQEASDAAETLYQQGRYHEALLGAETALRLARASYGAKSLPAAQSLVLIGNTHVARGRLHRALHYYRRALAILERSLGREHPAVGDVLLLIARAYVLRHQPDNATPLCERALQIHRRYYGPAHPEIADALLILAEGAVDRRDAAGAQQWYAQALEIQTAAAGAEHPDTLHIAARLNELRTANPAIATLPPPRVFRHVELPETAVSSVVEESAADGSARRPPDSAPRATPTTAVIPSTPRSRPAADDALGESQQLSLMARSFEERATAMLSLGRFAEAKDLFAHALEIYEKRLGPTHPETLAALERYVALLKQRGRASEADALVIRAREAGKASPP